MKGPSWPRKYAADEKQLAAGSGSGIARSSATLPGTRSLVLNTVDVETTKLIFEDGELRSTEIEVQYAMLKDRIPGAYAQQRTEKPVPARPPMSVRKPPINVGLRLSGDLAAPLCPWTRNYKRLVEYMR
jgi:hypothetical protein